MTPREPWDGMSDFAETDEPLEKVIGITALPPDVITGDEYDPAAAPEDPRREG